MVSSILVDAINNPDAAIQHLFESAPPEQDFPALVSAHFSDIFNSSDAFEEITPLSFRNPPNAFKNRTLVRFRGMVQDTPASPEMYLSHTGARCGGWGLLFDQHLADDVDYSNLAECNAFWIVSVPGETDWFVSKSEGDTWPPSSKDQHSLRTHKFPHQLPSLGVNAKVYEKSCSQSLKPTDVVTFVGILTSEALISDVSDNPIEVPTLHVLFTRSQSQPVVQYSYPTSDDFIHEDLVDWIAKEGLGGDRQAAEWVLLTAIAKVQSRRPALLPPALALTRFPPPRDVSATPALFHILSELLPISLILPLTLDLLNKGNFVPESKDEDLHSGYLQIPAGSMLLVTENGVKEGFLDEKGISNVRAIQEIIDSQTLDYVFPFSQFTFETEINVVVLSEGKKGAFFRADFVVAVDVSESEKLYKSKEEIKMPTLEKLESFRRLVGGARCVGKLKVGDEMSKYIEDEFVQERKERGAITQNDLIMRLTLAKLLATALHREALTPDVWEKAKKLDEDRKSRLTG